MSEIDDLKKALQSFQEKQAQGNKKTGEKKIEILEKFFKPEKTVEKFRAVPLPTTSFPGIEFAYFHEASVNGRNGKVSEGVKLYCPAHNDPKVPKTDSNGEPILDGNGKPIMIPAYCPLCEASKKILAKVDTSIQYVKKEKRTAEQNKIAERNKPIWAEGNKLAAKKFYIIRGVDRGQEKHGIKFWRFKENSKKEGAYDKLMPEVSEFIEDNGVAHYDPKNGGDIHITMTDASFMGHNYKAVSAIKFKKQSPLHADELVMKELLNDDITWRDVFKPKKTPIITTQDYLEMVLTNTTPYWDETDESNKRWVYPGRPDLEAKANTRTTTFGNDSHEEEFEQASDMGGISVNVNNVRKSDIGEFKEDAVDISAKTPKVEEKEEDDETADGGSDYEDGDDLPF